MELIYRRTSGNCMDVVVQCDPGRRTVLYEDYSCPARRLFISVPYTIFLLKAATSVLYNLHVFFLAEPLESTKTLLSLSCFPNCCSNGRVCLGRRVVSDSEEGLIRSSLDAFWTTIFTGNEQEGFTGIQELAMRTRTDPDAGMKVDWGRQTPCRRFGIWNGELLCLDDDFLNGKKIPWERVP